MTAAADTIASLSCSPGFYNPHSSSSYFSDHLHSVSRPGYSSAPHTKIYTSNVQRPLDVSEAFHNLHEYLILLPPKNLSAPPPVFLLKQKPRTITLSLSLPLNQANFKSHPFHPWVYFCLHRQLISPNHHQSCLSASLPASTFYLTSIHL